MHLHWQETQVCIEDAAGAIVLEHRIPSRRELHRAAGWRPRARILLEAAPESEWWRSISKRVFVASWDGNVYAFGP